MAGRRAAGIVSPCVGVCTLEGPYCIGCGRTLAEISRWSSMDAAERERIMAELPERGWPQPGPRRNRG